MTQRDKTQAGVVSLFIVIFTALLMTIITISFIQLMVKDQRQATTSDLSQSAYDSAQAGVEDAKRLLLLDQACREGTASSSVDCSAILDALTPTPGQEQTECDTLARSGIVSGAGQETIIQQSSGDNAAALDQAYTCVKIAVNTDDYLGQLEANESTVIPLRAAGEFRSVELSWFSDKDLTSPTDPTVGFPSVGADVSLPRVGARWPSNNPALMRAQVIQTGRSFELTDFDSTSASGRSNANTLFLYPSETGATEKNYAIDERRGQLSAPQPIRCQASLAAGGYACTVTLRLVAPRDGNTANRNAFLRLSALYNRSHFRVALKDASGNDVRFRNLQPEVDATGRANDLFRRVVSRVELRGDFTYPEAEVDIVGDLCKNFTITSDASGYSNSSTCNP